MASMRFRVTVVLGAVVVLTSVFAWGRRSRTVEPREPARAADLLPSETPPSTLGVPLALPLSVLVELLEEAVPWTHGAADSLRPMQDRGRTSIDIALERGPFRASLVDDVAHVATTLQYRLQLSYDLPALPDPRGSCGLDGELPPRLAVVLRSPISLASDWTLRTRTQVADVRPASEGGADRCEVTFLGLDVTDRVVAGAHGFLAEHLAEIDRRAASVDTRSRFEEWWSVLREPLQLGDSLWLSLEPEGITRGPITGTGDSVRVALGLRARPRIVLGARPSPLSRDLPQLDSGRIEPSLDLVVDGRADYAAGSRFLADRLVGTELRVGGTALRLESLRVYGIGGGRLAMQVAVSGDLRGRLYLTGAPVIDSTASRISVPDLDFDVSTGEAVLGIVPALVARSLRDFLRREASWPVDPAVRWLADWLRRGLNRRLSDDLRVTGTVDSVQIDGVYPLREFLLVRMSARGRASLVIIE